MSLELLLPLFIIYGTLAAVVLAPIVLFVAIIIFLIK